MFMAALTRNAYTECWRGNTDMQFSGFRQSTTLAATDTHNLVAPALTELLSYATARESGVALARPLPHTSRNRSLRVQAVHRRRRGHWKFCCRPQIAEMPAMSTTTACSLSPSACIFWQEGVKSFQWACTLHSYLHEVVACVNRAVTRPG